MTTRSSPIGERELIQAVRDAVEAGKRNPAGGVAPEVVAEDMDASRSTVQKHLSELADDGDLCEVWGLGPVCPRRSYLPPDHSDASDKTDDSRAWQQTGDKK